MRLVDKCDEETVVSSVKKCVYLLRADAEVHDVALPRVGMLTMRRRPAEHTEGVGCVRATAASRSMWRRW